MKTGTLVLYWILLLAPAMLLGGWAFRLLGHERERMERQVREAAGLRAEAAAGAVRAAVTLAERELTGMLRALPAGGEEARLAELRETHPLVRNAFVWQRGVGVVYPRAGESTSEERRFLSRYESLFSGRDPWPSQAQDDRPEGPIAPKADANRAFPADGWKPWFGEDRLYMLGWARRGDATVCGVELDWPVLLSRIVSDFPDPGADWTYVLTDGAGRPMHQRGPTERAPGAHPDLAVSLAPELPHWQLGAIAAPGVLAAAGRGGGFLLVGSLLIAIFLAAIASAGALLTWQALAQRRDAQRKTTFVSNVSHELKTPLTTIRMYAELLNEGRVQDEGKRRRYLDVMAQEAQRLTRLVNNVLDFSRLEQGRKTYRPEELAVGPFVDAFLATQGARLAAEGFQVHTAIDAPDTAVRFDRDALEQVLLNLVDNVTKYAAEGRELSLTGRPGPDGRRYTLAVEDRGPGVPREHCGRLFEKFYRGDPSLTTRRPGSGLGLSIARGLARDLGGDVRFEPREGGGSRFLMDLPLAPPAAGGRCEPGMTVISDQ